MQRVSPEDTLHVGQLVTVEKAGRQAGFLAAVVDPDWNDMVKVQMLEGPSKSQMKSYSQHSLHIHKDEDEDEDEEETPDAEEEPIHHDGWDICRRSITMGGISLSGAPRRISTTFTNISGTTHQHSCRFVIPFN